MLPHGEGFLRTRTGDLYSGIWIDGELLDFTVSIAEINTYRVPKINYKLHGLENL